MMSEDAQGELCSTVQQILSDVWDPIGIRKMPAEVIQSGWKDEYDMYVPVVCQMLSEEQAAIEIVRYLLWVETERMGLPARLDVATSVANALIHAYKSKNMI